MSRATYLYCVVRSKREPSLSSVPPLPRGGKPRALDAGRSLWLVAASVPLASYGEKPIEQGLRDLDWVSRCAVAHEAAVTGVTGHEALLPMKIFTIFTSDARALAHVEKDRSRIEPLLDAVAGCSEWGVRVALDAARVQKVVAGKAEAAKPASSAGRGFLLRKKKAKDAVRELASRAHDVVDAVFEKLARGARDARRRPPIANARGTRLLLDAAFLVPGKARARFETAVGSIARDLGGRGYEVTLTGPWPPYNFNGERT